MDANCVKQKHFVGYVHVNAREWERIASALREYATEVSNYVKGIDNSSLPAKIRELLNIDGSLRIMGEEMTNLHNHGRVSCDNTGKLVNVKEYGMVLGEMLALAQWAGDMRKKLPALLADSTDLTSTYTWMYGDMMEGLIDMAVDIDYHIIHSRGVE